MEVGKRKLINMDEQIYGKNQDKDQSKTCEDGKRVCQQIIKGGRKEGNKINKDLRKECYMGTKGGRVKTLKQKGSRGHS